MQVSACKGKWMGDRVMVTGKSLQWLIGTALVTALVAPVSAERLLATYQDLQAFVPDQAACGRRIRSSSSAAGWYGAVRKRSARG
jgi:hypothetical protein